MFIETQSSGPPVSIPNGIQLKRRVKSLQNTHKHPKITNEKLNKNHRYGVITNYNIIIYNIKLYTI